MGAGTAYTFSSFSNEPDPYLSSFDFIAQYAQVRISPSSLTLSRNSNATVTVNFVAPTGLTNERVPVYSGYIVIVGSNGDRLQIPYAGVAYQMKNINLTESSYYYAPSLRRYYDFFGALWDGGEIAENQSINLSQDSVVYRFRLLMPSPLVRVDLLGKGKQINAVGIKVLGSIADYPAYALPRNSAGELTEAFWNGTLSTGVRVPAGSYRMLLRVLKIFGNQKNGKDYETWTSPKFNIIY